VSPEPLRAYLERAPKAEVHLHLEGAVTPAFLDESAARHALPWAGRAGDELRARLGFTSLEGFLELFRWVLEEHLRTPEDYASALRHVAGALGAQNVRYAELSVSAGALLFFGRPLGEIAAALTETAEEVRRGGGPELRFVADGIRRHGPGPLERVAEAVLPLARSLWPALGLAGAGEDSVPAREFAAVFAEAKRGGLLADVHAGEAASPASVWEALEHLGADRLVHAVSAARDPALVQHLRDRRVPLALNPTSNVRTGAVPSLADHPLSRFMRAGLRVSVNTDDPTLFATTLADELEGVARCFRLGLPAVDQLILGGLECAFLPEGRRVSLLQGWGEELERLRAELDLDARVLGSPPHLVR